MDLTAMSWEARERDGDGDEWELRHDDDGFTYKILKRQRLLDPAASAAAQPPFSDPKAEESYRRKRRKKIILRLKSQYRKEIDQWELMSSTLYAMQDRANQQLELQKRQEDLGQTAFSPLKATEGSENSYGSPIDELLSQAEVQEAVIHDASYLCDMAETMCSAQQEQLAESYMDLPVWSSPRKLMASLCDD